MTTGLNLHDVRDRVAKHFSKTTRAPEKTKVAPFIDHKHPSLLCVLPSPTRVGNICW